MRYIIAGTNRPGSLSLLLAQHIQKIHAQLGEAYEILDLAKLDLSQLNGSQYSKNQPDGLREWIHKISGSRALVFVVPEYNGSFPGVLKYFIDHWTYPDCFEYRPLCFVGLGGRFGGLRPVEHLQQVFGYRNSYIFPERVFISNCWQIIKKESIMDPTIESLLQHQAQYFNRFVQALDSHQLDSISALKEKTLS